MVLVCLVNSMNQIHVFLMQILFLFCVMYEVHCTARLLLTQFCES
jgi:hypothetical protein